MNREKLIEKLIEKLKRSFDETTIIELHNEYCEDVNDYGSRIFAADELNDCFYAMSPIEVIKGVSYDFNINDFYFTFNGYGHAISFNFLNDENSPIDFSELADWLIEQDHEILKELDD